MGLVFGLIYLIGIVVALVTGRARAGLPQMGRLPMVTIFNSFEWFAHQLAAMLFWPLFLIVWLARGRPESPWQAGLSPRGNLQVVRVH